MYSTNEEAQISKWSAFKCYCQIQNNNSIVWFIFKSQVTPPAHRRPANVWNFPNGREKLKHLADQPPCLCGAGRYALAFCFYKFNVLLPVSQRGGGWVVENHSIGKHPFQGGVSTVVLPLVTSGCLLASVACVQFYLTLLLCEQLSFFLPFFFHAGIYHFYMMLVLQEGKAWIQLGNH